MMPHLSVLSTAFHPMTEGDQNENDRKARPPAAPTRPAQSLLYLPPPPSRRRPQSGQHPLHRRRAVPKEAVKVFPALLPDQKQFSVLLRALRGQKAVLRVPPCPPRTKSSSPCSSVPSVDKKQFSPAVPPLHSRTLPEKTFVPYLTSGASLSASRRNHCAAPQPDSRPPASPARSLEPPGPSNHYPLSTIHYPLTFAMNKQDLQSLREAAKAGATWKDLAAIIGVSDRTLRRWREEVEEEEEHPEGFFDGVEVEDRRPAPDDAAQILAAINAGRAEGRQELIELIRQQAVEKNDLRTLLALLKRMDSMDK